MLEPITDNDLTNIVRGFDAPAKSDLLEKLKEQALEREQEMERDYEENERESMVDFYRDMERDSDELER